MRECVPGWAAGYVGLPFRVGGRHRSGVDCWGLLVVVLQERFGLDVPVFDGIDFAGDRDRRSIAQFMAEHMDNWIEVPPGQEQPGDGILLRMMGHPIHVGVVVAKGWMLHIEEGIDACLERYDGPRWHRRVMGFYRYAG